MRQYRQYVGRGVFTLMELAVVAVVLGVVATIVGPRMTRASSSSPRVGEQLLVGHLKALRTAVRAYADEHGGHLPAGDSETVTGQLTRYTDWSGAVSGVWTPRFHLGPYLREIPAIPIGVRRNCAAFCAPGHTAADAVAGWVYDAGTGHVLPNVGPADVDSRGTPYSSY